MLPSEIISTIYSHLPVSQIVEIVNHEKTVPDPVLTNDNLLFLIKCKYGLSDVHLKQVDAHCDPMKCLLKLDAGKDIRYFVLNKIVTSVKISDRKDHIIVILNNKVILLHHNTCYSDKGWFDSSKRWYNNVYDETRHPFDISVLESLVNEEIRDIVVGKCYCLDDDGYYFLDRKEITITCVSGKIATIYFLHYNDNNYCGGLEIKVG